ncbi:MAG: TetR/AcrR family transcriptional regulator [Clostridia bacterium]
MPKILCDVKQQLFKTTREILKEGSDCFNMRALAQRSDIALGTIYNYYDSKVDLIIDMISQQWEECFYNIESLACQDFFLSMEKLYFHIYSHLRNFESDWLKLLATLSIKEKLVARRVEKKYMDRMLDLIGLFLSKDKELLSSLVVQKFGLERISRYIFDNFMNMLKTDNKDFSFLDFILRAIFEKK